MNQVRVLIGIMGMDQHEVGAIAVSRMLRDAGMEVIYTGRFNLPHMMVETSIQEDVDVIGVSCHSWEFLYYIPHLLELLKSRNVGIPVVVGGSVITPGDRRNLIDSGVAAAFGPSSSDREIVETLQGLMRSRESVASS